MIPAENIQNGIHRIRRVTKINKIYDSDSRISVIPTEIPNVVDVIWNQLRIPRIDQTRCVNLQHKIDSEADGGDLMSSHDKTCQDCFCDTFARSGNVSL